MPRDLLASLRKLRVDGVPVITEEGIELLQTQPLSRPSVVTPKVVAWIFVVLAACCFFVKNRAVDFFFVAVQALAGLFFAYLVSASGLPTSCWNWLIVPFNPLPLVFWHWRRWWAWPLGCVKSRYVFSRKHY